MRIKKRKRGKRSGERERERDQQGGREKESIICMSHTLFAVFYLYVRYMFACVLLAVCIPHMHMHN